MSQTSVANNKRIAKNTLLLYVRMLFIMAVSLYTSRVILNTLGVMDYGIYNVVGGIVAMFSFFNDSMITSTQRYLTFALGRNDIQKLKKVFSTSIYIHIIISIIILLLSETIGLWFFYEKMVIPEERMAAAMWVFQLSIITMIINVMSVPYNSAIVDNEKMNAFAMISVIEVLLKLLIVYMLVIGGFDKLIMYAILVAITKLCVRFIYIRYSHKHFTETRNLQSPDKALIKEIGTFAGWNIFGGLAAILMGTGLNLLLNVFFGPTVNAARGIAVQVETAITLFSTNFLMAVNPQITKLYSIGHINEMHTLVFRASKFTCFLLFTLSLPLLLETKTILLLWLKIVPDYTVHFLRLLLLIVIIKGMARPLMTSAQATGKVKKYQIVVGSILISILPISYVVLCYIKVPTCVYVVYLCITVIAFIARLFIVKPLISLSLRQFFSKVIIECFGVCLVSLSLIYVMKLIIPNSTLGSISICILSVLTSIIISYFIGLSTTERTFVNSKCSYLLCKIRH